MPPSSQIVPLYKILYMVKSYKAVVNETFDFHFTESEVQQFDIVSSNSTSHVIHLTNSTTVEILKADFNKRSYTVKVNGNRYSVQIENELDALISNLGLSLGEDLITDKITAPMPGLIIEVNVVEGQQVSEGDYLCVLEAMKMENGLLSPRDGIIKSITIAVGQTVDKGDLLIEFEVQL